MKIKISGLKNLKENIGNNYDYDENEFSDDDEITPEDIELIKRYKNVNDEIARLKRILQNLDDEIRESGIDIQNMPELDDIDL